jgi:hypothetical protein
LAVIALILFQESGDLAAGSFAHSVLGSTIPPSNPRLADPARRFAEELLTDPARAREHRGGTTPSRLRAPSARA